MSFSNQFALSVEVTRLLPITTVANKSAQALMNYARDLRHSGSDFVVEEDLVEVFGRSRISHTLGSSFRTIILESSSRTSLWEGITLQGGPGPTVARALREPPYFAMVIQLSLLVWSYEVGSSATALADALQKRLEEAPSTSKVPNPPSRNSVLEVLRTCERQTSAFNWNMILHAVTSSLGYSLDRPHRDLPLFILQGAIDMFPMVQSLPEDRLVYIKIQNEILLHDPGICFLVAWAHNVLGLVVTVRRLHCDSGDTSRTYYFGKGSSEQVILEEVTS